MDYPQIKAIKGQGKLYVRLEKLRNCETPVPSLPPQNVPSIANNADLHSVSVSSETIESEQQSTLCHQQINIDGNDDEKHIDALHVMFPTRSVEYLHEIRRNNITMEETVDDILCQGTCMYILQ